MTGGLVPHPAFQLWKSPSGLPMTTPWSVCAVGQPVKAAAPPPRPGPAAAVPQTTRASICYASFVLAPPLPPRTARVDKLPVASVTYSVVPHTGASRFDDDDEGLLQRIGDWMVWRVVPFCCLQAIGGRIEEAGTAIRAMIAVCCAALVLIALSYVPEAWEPISKEFAIGWGWVLGAVGKGHSSSPEPSSF